MLVDESVKCVDVGMVLVDCVVDILGEIIWGVEWVMVLVGEIVVGSCE